MSYKPYLRPSFRKRLKRISGGSRIEWDPRINRWVVYDDVWNEKQGRRVPDVVYVVEGANGEFRQPDEHDLIALWARSLRHQYKSGMQVVEKLRRQEKEAKDKSDEDIEKFGREWGDDMTKVLRGVESSIHLDGFGLEKRG